MKSITAGLILVSSIGFCQSAAPAFEVASVKRRTFPPGTHGFSSGAANVQISGNRVTVRGFTNIRGLVMYAYNVNEHQIFGSTTGDVWDNFYDIAAISPGEAAPSTDQLRLMVQALLADRFQLKLRHETATFPVYNLLIGRNGSKLKPSTPDAQPSIRNKNASAVASGSTYHFRFEYTHQPVSLVVRLLSNAAPDRLLLDKTGLAGSYDFNLEYTVDPADPTGAGTITEIQEQLGLRVEAAQEPLDRLVIERVQEPSEN
jgi:uncharacterized protein (TIGR03435 family)